MLFLMIPLFFSGFSIHAETTSLSVPSSVQDLIERAAQLRGEGHRDEAIRIYRRAIQTEPVNPILHRNMGILYYESRQFFKARRALEKSLKLDPDDPFTTLYLGKVNLMTDNLNQAFLYYQKVLDENPDMGEAHYNLGIVFDKQRQWGLAQERFERSKSLLPQDARPFSALGALLYRQKRYGEAIREFREAIRLDESDADSFNGLGVSYTALEEHPKALKAFRQAIALNPRDSNYINNLGVVLEKQGRSEEAQRAFRKAIEVAPANKTARENLEALLLKSEEKETHFQNSEASLFQVGGAFLSSHLARKEDKRGQS